MLLPLVGEVRANQSLAVVSRWAASKDGLTGRPLLAGHPRLKGLDEIPRPSGPGIQVASDVPEQSKSSALPASSALYVGAV